MNQEMQVTENQVLQTQGASLLDKDGMKQLFQMASFYSKAAIVPEMYQNSPENCFVACEMATRMNVSPMMVMQNLYIVKGKPSWSGQACVSMINNCGRFTGSLEFIYTGEKETPTYGCYAQIRRKDDGKLIKGSEITLQMANDEGWLSKKDKSGNEMITKWKTMTEQMLAYRAASFFARLHCPEVLMGLQTADEVRDTSDDSQNKKKTTLSLEME